MAEPLNYATPAAHLGVARQRLSKLLGASFLCPGIALAIAVVFVIASGERLMWEGAAEYFQAQFPFRTIGTICGIGIVLAGIAWKRGKETVEVVVAALFLNLLVLGVILYSYV